MVAQLHAQDMIQKQERMVEEDAQMNDVDAREQRVACVLYDQT